MSRVSLYYVVVLAVAGKCLANPLPQGDLCRSLTAEKFDTNNLEGTYHQLDVDLNLTGVPQGHLEYGMDLKVELLTPERLNSYKVELEDLKLDVKWDKVKYAVSGKMTITELNDFIKAWGNNTNVDELEELIELDEETGIFKQYIVGDYLKLLRSSIDMNSLRDVYITIPRYYMKRVGEHLVHMSCKTAKKTLLSKAALTYSEFKDAVAKT